MESKTNMKYIVLTLQILIMLEAKGNGRNWVKPWRRPATIRTTTDDSLENFYMKAIESFRGRMQEGIPELGLPILAPFYSENFTQTLQLNEYGISGQLNFKSLLIVYLDYFKIHKLSIKDESKTLKLKIGWKFLRVIFVRFSPKLT